MSGATKDTPLVISIHGVETRGAWQKQINKALEEGGFRHEPLDYDRWRAVKLWFKRARAKQITWFRDEYDRVRGNDSRPPSIIAHSFGSYLVARAMEMYQEVVFDRIILCGSIVRKDFPWPDLLEGGQCNAILNECGGADWPVKLAQWVMNDGGPSGRDGFTKTENARLVQRKRPELGHSDHFYSMNCRQNWIPFLKGHDLPPVPERAKAGINWRNALARTAVGLVAVVALVLLGLWVKRTWLTSPGSDSITIDSFAKDYEATGGKGLGFQAFVDQHLGKSVSWDAEIRDVYPHTQRPAYWIEPVGSKPDLQGRFLAGFDPTKFNKTLKPGAKVKIRCTIETVGPSIVTFKDCELIDQSD